MSEIQIFRIGYQNFMAVIGFLGKSPQGFCSGPGKAPLAEVSRTRSRQEWGKLLLVYSLGFFLLELSNKKIVLRFGSFVCFLVCF